MKKTLLILFLIFTSQVYAENLQTNPSNTSSMSSINSTNSGTINFTGAIVESTCELNSKIECIKDNKITPSDRIFTKKSESINENNKLVTITYH